MSATWKKHIKYRSSISDEEKRELEQKYKSARNAETKVGILSVGSVLSAVGLGVAGFATGVLPFFFGMGATSLIGTAAIQSLPHYTGEKKKYKENLEAVEGAEIKENRAPILLIRSFDDEELAVHTMPQVYGLGGVVSSYYKSTFAEAIEENCQRFGPVITSNNPRRDIQVLGGRHIYLLEENWHDEIKDIIKECQLIVAILGTSDGFMWELEQVAGLGLRNKLIIVLPDEPIKRWSSFFNKVRSNRTKYPNLTRLDLPMNLPRVESPCITFSKDGKFELNSLRWYEILISAGATTTAGDELVLDRIIRQKLKANSS
jgi:hypothetical protein